MSGPDDAAARIVALVEREREALQAFDSLPEVEIVGLSAASGAGAIGHPVGASWALRLAVGPWRVAGGPLRHVPLFVRRVAAEADIDALVARCEGRMRVRLRGRLQDRGDAQPAVLRLEGWLDAPVDDPGLEATLAAEHAPGPAVDGPPAALQHPRWGRLDWDDALARWRGTVCWGDASVTLSLDPGRGSDPGPPSAAADALFDALPLWSARLREVLSGELRALYNDAWRVDDDPPLEADAFAARVRLQSVEVGPDGQLDFWLDAEDLFDGHAIRISGQLDRAELVHALVG